MTQELLPCVEVEPQAPATCAVIWLHGLGADGHDFEMITPELELPAELAVRFVFPHAPVRPVTINGGMPMRAWYDIAELDLGRSHDEAALRASAAQVAALIGRENQRGIPAERIVLAGFSQGGAVAMHQALRHPERLAGLVCLSTYMVTVDSLEAEASEANRGLGVFQSHGGLDPMVTVDRGEAARDVLVAHGYDVTWSTWPMPHQVCMEQIRELGAWLAKRLGEIRESTPPSKEQR